MTALTTSRYPIKTTTVSHVDPIADGVWIQRGALCVLDETGQLRPGTAAPNLRVRGIATDEYDNMSSRYTHDGTMVETETGCFDFFNDIDNPLTGADIGLPCYILDDQTVTRNSTGHSVAGIFDRLIDFTSTFSERVFVRIGV
jgi:hypothetical protein